MIIYSTEKVNGQDTNIQVAEVPVTSKAVHKATLMKEDFIKLSFDAGVDYKFKAGCWVEHEGMRYYLPDDYYPTMKDEATFSYELQFNAPWYNLDKTMFLFNTYNGDTIIKRESDWYITDTAKNILALIIRSTNDPARNCQCQFNEILDCEPTVAKTFTFSSTSILAALNNLAKEFELEWWVTYEGGEFYLHFGECDNSVERDTDGGVIFVSGVRKKDSELRTELTAGENVTKPSISQKQGLKRFYYVFGSSRNIDQRLTAEDMQGNFLTSIVTKRLALDGNPQDMHEGSGEEVVIFDDIYPRSDYMITGVTPMEIVSEDVVGYDNDGNPIFKRFNVYNLKIQRFSDWIFYNIEHDPNVQNVEDMVASGKPLSLKFITKDVDNVTHTPKLAGFEFEVGATLVTDEDTGEQWYEFQIQHQEINGYILPNDTLIPEVGDWVCIFNIKGAYADSSSFDGVDQHQYDTQQELLNAFLKWYNNKKRDVSYTIKPYANEDIDLNIGDAVVLTYKENEVISRVYSFEKHLDHKIDASYTISSYAKMGSVNQLKEDVKILTASIANGTAGGELDASSLSNAVATYGRRLFLSKTTEDTANGHITFNEGLSSQKDSHLRTTTFGTFSSGYLGTGACIDSEGRAEVKSLYSREFISTPEFRFNRITVTEGEQWNTNGFGVIDDVIPTGRTGKIYLRLEKGDRPSVAQHDICRGIYNNIGYKEENDANGYDTIQIGDQTYDIDNQPEYDSCNFPTKNGFFTSYFLVTSVPRRESQRDTEDGDCWSFTYSKKDIDTPDPCKNMKFAQYGNRYDKERQSSLYQTSIRHSYIQQLENVDTWEISSVNIASRYGYLGDLTVLLKDSNGNTYERTLEGNGLYVQDNVYFGNATIQLDPVTIEDLRRQLANYEVYLTAYTDVIKVDDAGNVVDGLWVDSGEGENISRQYRIYTDVTARNGVVPLLFEERNVPIGEGYYKIHVQPYGCSCIVDHSTIYITGIDNVKDGVAGSSDDVNFDYDACRAMERVYIDIEVDCEGVGVIRKTMPITIKHDPVPYIMADLTNENAGISWSSELASYVGLPVETIINMSKGNIGLSLASIAVNSINGVAPSWSGFWQASLDGTMGRGTSDGWSFSFNLRTGLFRVKQAPYDLPAVTEILITCQTTYAGVSYERTLSLHIMRGNDLAIWEIIPNHQTINVDRNSYFNFNRVGVSVFCTDATGRNEVTELPDVFSLCYRITQVVPSPNYVAVPSVPAGTNPSEEGWYESDGSTYSLTSDTSAQVGKTYYTQETIYTTVVGQEEALGLDESVLVSDSSYANTIKSVVFTLYNEHDVLLDSEEVPIVREGTGGEGSTGPAGNGVQGVTTYYLRTKSGYIPTGNETITPDSELANGGWGTTFVAPTEEWPCVWMFTKYDYTQAASYRSPAQLLTTWSRDGIGIVGVDIYYTKTNVGNAYQLTYNHEEGNTFTWGTSFVEPDSTDRFVWRYMKFTYSEGEPYYSVFEMVAKFVEDGTSTQTAYKVFPVNDNPSWIPTLDNVSTGANPPATNQSLWSLTTTGIVVGEGNCLWMTQRTHKGTTSYDNWQTPVRISGNKGDNGADGKDIEFIYKLSNDGNPTSADKPTYDFGWQENIGGVDYKFDDDDFNPSDVPNAQGTNLGWWDNPRGVGTFDGTFYKYEWMCQRVKPKGSEHWGGWTDPVVWSAYGDTGMDGDGVEYVFKLNDSKPSTPSNPQFQYRIGNHIYIQVWSGGVELDGNLWRPKGWDAPSGATFMNWVGGVFDNGEWIPSGWTDEPKGVSDAVNNKKEWVSQRKRINGVWGEFSPAALWAMFSEAPNLRIVDGYWYIGDEPLLDSNGNPVKAEGDDGTGVRIKGKLDYYSNSDIPSGETGKKTLQGITEDSNIIKEAGDCYLVNANRILYVYNASTSSNWEEKWTDLGEFKGVKGDSAYLHIAWATGRKEINGVLDHPIVVINGVEQNQWFDVVQQAGVEYEWMGIFADNNESDPSRNDEWSKYAWNHNKGKDGTNYERVYIRTQLEVTPTIDSNNPDSQNRTKLDDEYLPRVGNMNTCKAFSYYFTDDPHGVGFVNVNGVSTLFKYEWMSERKKVDGVWQDFSQASLWATYAEDGSQGDSVSDVYALYLKTTMATGVTTTNNPLSNWSRNFIEPDEENPYLWRCVITVLSDGTEVQSSDCERIAVYSPVPNINLLDDTAFSSDVAMEAWLYKGVVSGDPYADPSNPNYNDEGNYDYDNFFGVTTGTQGHNAYYGRFRGSAASGSYVLFLQQRVIDEGMRAKIEPNRWYTLSYWVKGNAVSKFDVSLRGYNRVNNSNEEVDFVDIATGFYVNGVLVKNKRSYQFKYNNDYPNGWTKHTITFKTKSSFPMVCYIQWVMYNETSLHEIYICMPKLEVGMIATTYSDGPTNTKAFPRAGKWESGKQYYAGNIGEMYIDAVYYGNNWYRCIKAHISDSDNSPISVNSVLYWKEASWSEFTATGLLLAQEAFIENLAVGIVSTNVYPNPRVVMRDGEVAFYGNFDFPNIKLGVDEKGAAILKFFDYNNQEVYDLGPTKIWETINEEDSIYISAYRKKVESSTRIYNLVRLMSHRSNNDGVLRALEPTDGYDYIAPLSSNDCTAFDELFEGWTMVGQTKRYKIQYLIDPNTAGNPSVWNRKIFKTNANRPNDNILASASVSDYVYFINDGWYASPLWGPFQVSQEGISYIQIKRYVKGSVADVVDVYFIDDDVLSHLTAAKCYASLSDAQSRINGQNNVIDLTT